MKTDIRKLKLMAYQSAAAALCPDPPEEVLERVGEGHVVVAYRREDVGRGNAWAHCWCNFLNAHNTPDRNPWRRCHTANFWAWYRPKEP